MADKQTALSIVIRTVDAATAKIQAINKRLDAITKPTRDFGKALKDLGEKSGFNAVMDGFSGVGRSVEGIGYKVLAVGAIVGEATHLVLELVGQFATLGNTAKRAGVEADFLAGMRYAAEQSGVSMEQLDQGITTLTQNLGQMKSGTGRAFKFIGEHVSQAFLHQLVGAHGTAEAIGLIADALAKIPDAERRAALTQKLLGDNALAPMLAKGSKGVQELLTAYAGLAGPQGEAAASAIEVEHSLHDLHAATDGVKAALVTGLSPALKIIVDKLKVWLVDHRGDVERWAEDIGKKLPGAVQDLVDWVGKAYDKVTGFVDSIGGWKNAAIAIGLVIEGPLIGAIANLGIALATSPFGALALAAAGATLAIWGTYSAVKGLYDLMDSRNERLLEDTVKLHSGEISESQFEAIHPGVLKQRREQSAAENELISGRMTPEQFELKYPGVSQGVLTMAQLNRQGMFGPADPSNLAPRGPWMGPRDLGQQGAAIKVEFVNAPKGMRATVDPRGAAAVDLTVGHNMLGATP